MRIPRKMEGKNNRDRDKEGKRIPMDGEYEVQEEKGKEEGE